MKQTSGNFGDMIFRFPDKDDVSQDSFEDDVVKLPVLVEENNQAVI